LVRDLILAVRHVLRPQHLDVDQRATFAPRALPSSSPAIRSRSRAQAWFASPPPPPPPPPPPEPTTASLGMPSASPPSPSIACIDVDDLHLHAADVLQRDVRWAFLHFYSLLLENFRAHLYFLDDNKAPFFDNTEFLTQVIPLRASPFFARWLDTTLFSDFLNKHRHSPAFFTDLVHYIGEARAASCDSVPAVPTFIVPPPPPSSETTTHASVVCASAWREVLPAARVWNTGECFDHPNRSHVMFW
jgi:hypothetical protein